jgi:selenide,water dikinase
VLDSVLGKLARQHDPNVLVGFDTADDAGVYQLTPELALVQTVDFFTPIVDDPFVFGQIAATNSLSDIYAMGGKPITALTIVCFPDNGDPKVLEEMLAGGLSKMVEANCTIIGGHSIRDEEIKLGYSVTGTIHPQKVLANSGALAGDRLIFTKAIGTGVISTAIKRGTADFSWIRAAVHSMTMLNKAAAEVVISGGFAVHSVTDVTGFGLIGHAREVALGSHVSLRIHASRVPLLPGALECVRGGFVPGGLKANRQFAEACVEADAGVPQDLLTLLYDPQTAGGLLISVAASDAAALIGTLCDAGIDAVEIGEVLPKQKPLIAVLP